jgi:sugar lactone lactonase YvrE
MNRLNALTLTLMFATAPVAAQDIPLSKILVEKEPWRQVAANVRDVTHLDAAPTGEIAINQNGAHCTLTTKGEILPGPNIIIVRTAKSAMTQAKRKYAIDADGKSINCFEADKKHAAFKADGLKFASCLALWPDEGHLVIGESEGAYLWAVRIEKNGSLGPGDRYYSLRTKPNEKMHVTAMVMDAGYLLYACTPLGIQVFDPTGRLSGVIASPSKETMTAITIGGATADELFVAAGEKIYARRIQGKAAYSAKK